MTGSLVSDSALLAEIFITRNEGNCTCGIIASTAEAMPGWNPETDLPIQEKLCQLMLGNLIEAVPSA
ncbi:MAG: hypothetical protein JRH18_02710 [Deltaproteobacteria bacterium]|nr:hypothetical protein [Deltaproteobacteria bacterium]MBW1961925.1 hypothetical protein [Deltaproteobacteria bacterium]MBW2150559.1 hypothetical protein [Deltaproteobacteria bacterium]